MIEYPEWQAAYIDRQAAWSKQAGTNSFDNDFYLCELIGEVGEAANICKKLERESLGVVGSRSSAEALLDELADVVICVRNLAIRLGILSNVEQSISSLSGSTLTRCSVLFGYYLGNVCSVAVNYDSLLSYKCVYSLGSIISLAYKAAEMAKPGVDFEGVLIDKFNHTSEKYGFPHRIKRTFSLEETFK